MIYAHTLLKRHGPGLLLVAATLALLVGATQVPQAQTLTTIYNFTGGADGAQPFGTLVKDKQGNLYGTTWSGGFQSPDCNMNGSGCGTVFELTPSGRGWSFNLLYSFQGYPNDGANPDLEALVFDKAGNLYGTTFNGGDLSCPLGAPGCGTVFKLTTSGSGWTESVLHNFDGGGGADDAWPVAGLVLDKKGDLYGTADGYDGPGEVFELTASGVEKVLHYFMGGADGYQPAAGLVFDRKGNLYGTTISGGRSGCWGSGCGTVFKLAPDGTLTVLYSFAGGADGVWPRAGLIFDKQGNLYGTTWVGGGSGCGGSGCGTVFEVTPTGTETVLHSFDDSDGSYPGGGVVFDAKGSLYGTTAGGGAHSYGTIFKLTASGGQWTETVLHYFDWSDGGAPYGSLLRKGSIFYGTTYAGGAYNQGTVFALNPNKKKQ